MPIVVNLKKSKAETRDVGIKGKVGSWVSTWCVISINYSTKK